jgi:enoyl-CoA hydratase/carnithine racemase
MPEVKTSYSTIRYEVADAIATITLDRPDRLNAFTEEMLEDVVQALDRAEADDAVRVVIFTGEGRAYCAGSDLGPASDRFAPDESTAFSMERDADGGGVLGRRLFDSTKPVIAAINGPAVGIGLTMTLAMDIRMVSETAKLGFVFARRGIVPETASAFFLPRIVGISQAAEWMYTGRVFGPDEALRAGLVRSVHAAGELLPAARALAAEMAQGTSSMSVALTRRMIWQQLGGDGHPNLAHEMDSEALVFMGTSGEAAEGIASFLEKRDADFPLRLSQDLPDFYARWQAERGGLRPGSESATRSYDRLRPGAATTSNGGDTHV